MAVRYTSTVKVVVPQLVHCIHCDAKFVYEMTVTGIGCAETGPLTTRHAAEKAAEKGARADLELRLRNQEELFNAIPCRNCHRYQPYMHRLVGLDHYSGMGCVGYPLLIVGFLATLNAVLAWFFEVVKQPTALVVGSVGLAAILVGLCVVSWMHRLAARHDPNTHNREERRRIATERTMSLEDYDELQARRLVGALREFRAAQQDGRSRSDNPFADTEPLVVDWWAPPTVFVNGGTIPIKLSEGEYATVEVPEDTEPGTVFELATYSDNVVPFQVRVHAIYAHQGEMRMED